MTLSDLIKKLSGKGMFQDQSRPEEQNTDRYLVNLRVERRKQMEVEEKERLKREIQEWHKQRERENLWSIKDNNNSPVDLMRHKESLMKQKSILRQKNILKAKKLIAQKGMFSQRYKLR